MWWLPAGRSRGSWTMVANAPRSSAWTVPSMIGVEWATITTGDPGAKPEPLTWTWVSSSCVPGGAAKSMLTPDTAAGAAGTDDVVVVAAGPSVVVVDGGAVVGPSVVG